MNGFYVNGLFDQLYNVIFPFLGNIFGFLARLAETPVYNFVDWFFALNPTLFEFQYWNLFTGNMTSYFSPLYGNILAPVVGNSFLVILRTWGISGDTPTWCALILIAVNLGIITRCLKSLIPGL